MKKRLLILETIYSLFIYFLISSKKEIKETTFLVNSIFYENNIELVKKLEEVILFNHKNKDRLPFFKRIFYFWKIKLEIRGMNIEKYKKIYGLDHTLIGNYCIRRNFILLEDGSFNYNLKKISIKNKIRNIIYGRNLTLGQDKRIEKIYLTGLAPIPETIKNKVEIINLRELWNKKSEEEKKEILEIFCFSFEIIKKLKQRGEVLFTQPLSEDGILLENEKIEIYKKIIKNYDVNGLIIKKHPREKTDYKKFFPNIEILNQAFPSEFFDILDIKLKKAITIFSTAVCTIGKDVEIDFYGTEIHPKILKKFGSQEHIMKRNKFLEE